MTYEECLGSVGFGVDDKGLARDICGLSLPLPGTVEGC